SHYRSPINYSEDNLREARGALERFYRALKGLPEVPVKGGEEFVARFGKAMDDDFNTPEACAVLFEMAREVNRLKESDPAAAAGRGQVPACRRGGQGGRGAGRSADRGPPAGSG